MDMLNLDGLYYTLCDAGHIQPGDIIANLGMVEKCERDGVFVIFTISTLVWLVASGKAIHYDTYRVFHEVDTLIVSKDPYNE